MEHTLPKSPENFSFDAVNDFVHDENREFEEMQSLCLSMATRLEALEKSHAELLAALLEIRVEAVGGNPNTSRIMQTAHKAIANAQRVVTMLREGE